MCRRWARVSFEPAPRHWWRLLESQARARRCRHDRGPVALGLGDQAHHRLSGSDARRPGLAEVGHSAGKIFSEQAETWSPGVGQITPGHLLTHTSGLPRDELLREFFLRKYDGSGSALQDREEVVRDLSAMKLQTKPGEKYAYSNLGYVLLGAIVDKRGGTSWEEHLEKKLFQPLGIKSWGLGGIGKKDAVEQLWSHDRDGKPIEPYSYYDMVPVMNSAGRIHIALADYMLFLAELVRLGRGETGLLKPATVQGMFSKPYPVSLHCLGGWGCSRKNAQGPILSHTGSNDMNFCSVPRGAGPSLCLHRRNQPGRIRRQGL